MDRAYTRTPAPAPVRCRPDRWLGLALLVATGCAESAIEPATSETLPGTVAPDVEAPAPSGEDDEAPERPAPARDGGTEVMPRDASTRDASADAASPARADAATPPRSNDAGNLSPAPSAPAPTPVVDAGASNTASPPEPSTTTPPSPPVTPPSEPVTTPPAEPVTPPSQPVTPSAEPVTTPADPVTPPSQPVTPPATGGQCVAETTCATTVCFPLGVLPCCRLDGSCGCTWAAGAYCL